MSKKNSPPNKRAKKTKGDENKVSESRAVGRPRVYQDEYAEQARKLCLLGHTDAELAKFFEVDERTINRWKHDFPDFCQSIQKGKVLADADIAEALYHRAKGYSHPETQFFQYKGTIVAQDTIKHYAPDTGAAFIWLKNRQSGKWKDKHVVEDDDYVPPVKIAIEVVDARKPENASA